MLSADDRLIDTHQTGREGSRIFIRSEKVHDLAGQRYKFLVPSIERSAHADAEKAD